LLQGQVGQHVVGVETVLATLRSERAV
jgi:hypothetical protein